MYRVLITGSRRWQWPATIFTVLDDLYALQGPGRLSIVHGACPRGADHFAATWCRSRCVTDEPHPADWSLGRRAGHLRNAEMVATRPNLCIAFIRDASPGAANCAELAQRAGIPTIRHLR